MQEEEKINTSPVGTNGEQVLGEEPVVVQETPIDMTQVSMTSRGERLCGISFNPSGSDEVATVKRACAYLMDVLEKHREENSQHGTLTADREFLINHALGQVLNAQMNVVKVITFDPEV
jgi:hypothetical protein